MIEDLRLLDRVLAHQGFDGAEVSARLVVEYHTLVNKHRHLGATLRFFNMGRYRNLRENPESMGTLLKVPDTVEAFRERMLRKVCTYYEFTSATFRELLDELRAVIAAAVQEFLDLFGENILDYKRGPAAQALPVATVAVVQEI